ncbi:hypothetical protein F5X96DRAFT_555764 [Biscogniauxia mediterranea]|nr:hypothetical protein F5X96DRAFT_555764 [Biscogniauxia mediterranea]
MDLAPELQKVQEQLQRLQDETGDFEKKSKIMIDHDHAAMLASLQASAESIKQTQKFLETRLIQPAAAANTEDKPDAGETATSRALVRQYAKDLSAKSHDLCKAAGTALTHVEDVKARWDDFDAEVGGLQTRIQALAESSQAAVTSAEQLLGQKERSIQQASETLKAHEAEIQRLREQVERSRRKRGGFLGGLAASLVVSVVFPPAAIVALPLAGGSMAMLLRSAADDEVSTTKDGIRGVEAQLRSLRSESETLRAQKTELQGAAAAAHELESRCAAVGQKNGAARAAVGEKLRTCHEFKVATDEFAAMTRELAARAEAMELVGPSEKALRKTVRWFVGGGPGEEEGRLGSMHKLLESIASSDDAGEGSE